MIKEIFAFAKTKSASNDLAVCVLYYSRFIFETLVAS